MEQLAPFEYKRLELQAELDAAKERSERNRLGQFATPTGLALDIVRHAKTLLPTGESVRFLDPAIGTGSFYSALLCTFPSARIVAAEGFEIDPHHGELGRELWRETPLKLHVADFTRAKPPKIDAERFNLVICNPPYVRHHHLPVEEKVRLQRATLAACGVRIAGLAGLYCYFLGLSHLWIAEFGTAGWLIPSEFMDVNYGKPVKRYLLDQVTLLRVHRFDPNEVQFGDALVSSAVVWFRKVKPPTDHTIEFTFGGSLAQPRVSRMVPATVLHDEPKWTRFPASELRENPTGLTLADFFTIKRGLATGNNRFFILTREQITGHGLPMKFFRPILPSPRYLPYNEVLADSHGNPLLERQLFLLDCRLPEGEVKAKYPRLWQYLEAGMPEVSDRYLCKARSPWYSQEDRPAPPLICTYMGRGNLRSGRVFRFILNHSRATAANVYLLLYPKPIIAQAIARHPQLARKVWATLNEVCPQTLLAEGRVYGGGLHKIEPRELANVPAEAIAALLPASVRPPAAQPDLFKENRASPGDVENRSRIPT